MRNGRIIHLKQMRSLTSIVYVAVFHIYQEIEMIIYAKNAARR